jgi:hypothetical protein
VRAPLGISADSGLVAKEINVVAEQTPLRFGDPYDANSAGPNRTTEASGRSGKLFDPLVPDLAIYPDHLIEVG